MRILEININKSNYHRSVDEHDTLAKILREKVNLTGHRRKMLELFLYQSFEELNTF